MANTVVITGCSTGIGRATAEYFHEQGWNVVATMRAPDRETELKKLPSMLVTRLDVQDVDSIRYAVDAGIAMFGRIDALVNNAGYGAYGPLEATPLEKIRRQFDVNVIGLLATTQALLSHFRANRSGTIVNISSSGGRVAFPLGALYHGTKFAVEGISEALQYELAKIGVKMKVVEPGVTNTDFTGRSIDFSNDPDFAEYQPLVHALMDVFGPRTESGSPPRLIAELIHTAVTDGTNQLRYAGGPDAVQLLENRRAVDDATFFAGMRAQFGIS